MSIDFTAYCGIYCGDCIHYRNRHSKLAGDLKKELELAGFDKYAGIESPFGNDFKYYRQFSQVLNALAKYYCGSPCRAGGGCSSTPCRIMECCRSKGFAGCWECSQIDNCERFKVLEPRCGDAPKNNLRIIKKYGLDGWVEHREKFYIWL